MPVQIPLIDTHEVGTGGGSIARIATAAGCASGRKAPAPHPARCATTWAVPCPP